MADVLRQLLDSGKLSDEDCRSILRGLGKQVDELRLSKNEHVEEEEEVDEEYCLQVKESPLSKTDHVDGCISEEEEEVDIVKYCLRGKDSHSSESEHIDGWTSEEEEEVDEEYCRQVKETMGFDIGGNVRIPRNGIQPTFIGADGPCNEVTLYGRLGVHCFNFGNGKNLQYMRIPKYSTVVPFAMSFYINVEVKDLADNSPHIFQTLVTRFFAGKDLKVSTEFCRIKPKTPGGEFYSLDEEAIDEFYKGCMPNFVSKVGAGDDNLRFYEVQEQDICENDWLRLYTEFALYSIWRYNEEGYKSCLPVEIKKIIVETCEAHREPRLKLKSSNAIFHINFSADNCDYNSVVRRTMDGISGHMGLEISSWFDQPSSA